MSVPGTPPTPERTDSAAAEAVSEPATPPESASAREGVDEAQKAAERSYRYLMDLLERTPERSSRLVVPIGALRDVLSLAAGFRREAEDPEPNAWRIEVTVPLALPTEQRQQLFEAVVGAVGAWEPDDRDGWDADVSGHPVYDQFAHVQGEKS